MLNVKIERRTKATDVFVRELSNPRELWQRADLWLTRLVGRMFDMLGGMYGQQKWPEISPTIYDQPRIGTDFARHGVYGPASRPLQASGLYRKSFGQVSKPRPNIMVWGSTHPMADLLPHAGRGGRFALPKSRNSQFTTEWISVYKGFLSSVLKKAAKA